MECPHDQHNGITLFCPTCHKVVDKDALKTIKFRGFIGTASLKPTMEKFWHTGDPEDTIRR